jgi:hypothetical protein
MSKNSLFFVLGVAAQMSKLWYLPVDDRKGRKVNEKINIQQ